MTACLDCCSAANGMAQKLYNWSTLNMRVFKRLGFVVAQHECEVIRSLLSLASSAPGMSEPCEIECRTRKSNGMCMLICYMHIVIGTRFCSATLDASRSAQAPKH